MIESTSILFLCTGNSARSILAEAIANQRFHPPLTACSAGSHPKGAPHPLALSTLARHGLETDGLASEPLTAYAGRPFDLVVTLCGSARDACPTIPGARTLAHWDLPDPPADPDPAAAFERVFDHLCDAIEHFIAADGDDVAQRATQVAERLARRLARPVEPA